MSAVSILGNFRNFLATFYFNIWSHCPSLKFSEEPFVTVNDGAVVAEGGDGRVRGHVDAGANG